MDDLTTYALLATSFFFVALSVGLLVRYRRVSERINASTDLGRDLSQSLEQRLKKQDERILDMMGRLEVVQSRVLAATAAGVPAMPSSPAYAPTVPASASTGKSKPDAATELGDVVQQPGSQESQPSQALSSFASSGVKLDETQLTAMRLLSESSKDTRQLTDALRLSREHTARVMKGLFEVGFVKRDDSSKPFVYQLTDEGRSVLSSGQA